MIPDVLSFPVSGNEPVFLFWSWFGVLQCTRLLAGVGQDVTVLCVLGGECPFLGTLPLEHH